MNNTDKNTDKNTDINTDINTHTHADKTKKEIKMIPSEPYYYKTIEEYNKLDKEKKKNYVCIKCLKRLTKCKCNIDTNIRINTSINNIEIRVIEIDKSIQTIIRILNKKGYKTRYSCEGHYGYTTNIQITFKERYQFNIPKGYKYKKNNLTYSYKSKNINDFNKEKRLYINILKSWTKTLKPIDNSSSNGSKTKTKAKLKKSKKVVDK